MAERPERVGIWIAAAGALALLTAAERPLRAGPSAAEALDKAKAALGRKDDAGADKWYRVAAEQGDAEGQHQAGVRILSLLNAAQSLSIMKGEGGKYPDKDCPEAWDWVQKAADQGHAKAALELSWLHGDQVACAKPDKEKARSWLRKAAERGDAGAQLEFGKLVQQEGGAEGEKAAAGWYQKAADQGNGDAKQALWDLKAAQDRRSGKGPGREALQKAKECDKGSKGPYDCEKLFISASNEGNVEAAYAIGRNRINMGNAEEVCITLGGCQGKAMGNENPSIVYGVKWLRKAADLGYAEAQNDLGEAYESGNGIAADPVKAGEWYRKAAGQGHAKALEALERLKKAEKP